MKDSIRFDKDENGIRGLAVFVSQLVREGVSYEIENRNTEYVVTLTGGY